MGAKILKEKLWAYSRHPNYLGEIVTWLGFWLMVVEVPQYGLLSFISPLYVFLRIRGISVPAIENKYRGNPEYKKYLLTTSMLLLWVPKPWED